MVQKGAGAPDGTTLWTFEFFTLCRRGPKWHPMWGLRAGSWVLGSGRSGMCTLAGVSSYPAQVLLSFSSPPSLPTLLLPLWAIPTPGMLFPQLHLGASRSQSDLILSLVTPAVPGIRKRRLLGLSRDHSCQHLELLATASLPPGVLLRWSPEAFSHNYPG